MRWRHWTWGLAGLLTLLVRAPMPLEPLRAAPPVAETQPAIPIRIQDIYLFDYPSAVALAPDARRVVYVRTWIDRRHKEERQSLWTAADKAGAAQAMEPGEPDARGPVFSPDGKWIAFRSTRPRPDGWRPTPKVPPQSGPATDIWLMPAAAGAAIPLARPDKPYGRVLGDPFYGCVAFSPDGRRLVFVADDGADPRIGDDVEAGVSVVHSDQGEGYTGYGPAQIWVAHLADEPGEFAADKIDRLTHDDVWYGDPQWSPDGATIVVHANRTDDRESVRYSINKNFDLWEIDPATRKLRQLTTGPGPEFSPRFSPDGKRLICLSSPRKGPHFDVFNFVIVALVGKKPSATVLFDHHGPDAEKPPHASPSFPLPDDCWDGADHVVYQAAVGTHNETLRLDLATGKAVSLDDVDQGESRFKQQQMERAYLTPPGNTFLQNRLLGRVETIAWTSYDGTKIEGVLTLPNVQLGIRPYKLLVYPHGGPHGHSVEGFNFTAEVFAAHGYAVLQPNFRGSTGYGLAFLDAARGDLGGRDMADILSGVNYLVRHGFVDENREFVYGSSYGGFMTSWLVGHSKRFRAAVAQNAVTDMNAMWGLSDLQSWTEWELGGKPWEIRDVMRSHSPTTYLDQVETPTLILNSRDDRRCPLPMGRMFYRGLMERGVPTGMVIYPDEGHGIRQPRHRADVLRRTLAWFAAHDDDE